MEKKDLINITKRLLDLLRDHGKVAIEAYSII
jgi:hypothetical protein